MMSFQQRERFTVVLREEVICGALVKVKRCACDCGYEVLVPAQVADVEPNRLHFLRGHKTHRGEA